MDQGKPPVQSQESRSEMADQVAPLPTVASILSQFIPGSGVAQAGGSANTSSSSLVSAMSSASTSRQQSQASLPVDETVYTLTLEDYDIGKMIGYGSSATVNLAHFKATGKVLAIKIIDLDQFERNQIDELRKELQVMQLCRHPNLLTVKASFVNAAKLYIVTPLLYGGSCLDIMKQYFVNGLDEAAISCILKQALAGLEYLHKTGLIHRDIKSGNLLMDEDGTVKVADFGVSSSLFDAANDRNGKGGLRKTFVGTPCWIAPEIVQQTGYDYKADLWSFGITALELAHGHAPLSKMPPMKVLLMTLQSEPPTLDRNNSEDKRKFSKSFKDMIDSCLQKDPSRRPTTEKLSQHSFFRHAKKKQYLVDTIIKKVKSVADRVHKEPKVRAPMTHNEAIWNFDDIDAIQLRSGETSLVVSPSESDDALNASMNEALVRTPGLQLVQSGTSQKKGRFVVDVSPQTVASQQSGQVKSAGANSDQVKSQPHSRTVSLGNSQAPVGLGVTVDSAGVKKGRFSVINDQIGEVIKELSPLAEDDNKRVEPQSVSAIANESLRRGRFEVTSNTSSPIDSSNKDAASKQTSKNTANESASGTMKSEDISMLLEKMHSPSLDPFRLSGGSFGGSDLPQLLEQVAKAIQQIDSQRLLFVDVYIKLQQSLQVSSPNESDALRSQLKKALADNDRLKHELQQLKQQPQ